MKKPKGLKFFLFYILFLLRPVIQFLLTLLALVSVGGGFMLGANIIFNKEAENFPVWIPIIMFIIGFLAYIGKDRYDVLILRLNPDKDISRFL